MARTPYPKGGFPPELVAAVRRCLDEPNSRWRESAACTGYPTDWWFPERGYATKENKQARKLCEGCPVRADCIVASEGELGVWGYDPDKRRTLLKLAGRVRVVSACGTPAGYHRHYGRKEEICEPCKAAWYGHKRELRARKGAKRGRPTVEPERESA